jgi:antitoxin component of MazEF toxin-antitoxin module
MTIKTTQKVIKIGTSAGVTIPAKDLKRAGINPGDEVIVSIESIDKNDNLPKEYTAFKKQYGDTLKNLADR